MNSGIFNSTRSGVDIQVVYLPQMELRLLDLNRSAVFLNIIVFNTLYILRTHKRSVAEMIPH